MDDLLTVFLQLSEHYIFVLISLISINLKAEKEAEVEFRNFIITLAR